MYKSTAGKIEDKDVENRLEYNGQERYDISPDIDDSDVVFAEKDDFIPSSSEINKKIFSNILKSSIMHMGGQGK